MPVNTNKHNFNQFLRGVFTICIVFNKYNENSPQFAEEVVAQTPIPATIIYFNLIGPNLLESQCFNQNVKAIYHFISKEKKVRVVVINIIKLLLGKFLTRLCRY